MLLASYKTVDAQSGLYEAEDYSRFTYSGSGWSQLIDGDYITLESSQLNDRVDMSFTGSSVILYREIGISNNVLQSGAPSASSAISTLPNLLDGNVATSWVPIFPNTWLMYTLPSSSIITQYSITAQAGNSHPLSRMPRSWLLEYYNGSSWETADTVTDQIGWFDGETRFFTVSQNNSSNQWRITFTENNGDPNWIAIGEFAMFSDRVRVCVGALCNSFSNSSSERRIDIPVAFSSEEGTHTLSITNLAGGLFRLNNIIVMSSTESDGSPLPAPLLEETIAPDPSRHHFVLDSGRVVALDFVISGGDIATSILLVFLSSITVFMFMNGRFSNGID